MMNYIKQIRTLFFSFFRRTVQINVIDMTATRKILSNRVGQVGLKDAVIQKICYLPLNLRN
jgi:hypothetical protein